ncbi:MAG: NAD(P)/FAD-dependent oxidoreductase [Bacteroidia bacterium]|nr:NAD(P)/FAD-dependent oxidoreductase [Bacteroidia bacterium]
MFKPKSYKRFKPETPFDVIIIGSGIGGMAAGSLLSQDGYKVLMLEQHYTAGGFTHMFKRGDWEWDVGIHYIGEVNRPQSFLKIMFDAVTDGSLNWHEMSDIYDKVIIAGRQFNFPKGTNNFKDYLKKEFPGEEKAIDQYIQLVYKVANSALFYFMDKTLHPVLSNTIGYFLRRNFLKYSDKTTLQVLQSLTSNKELIGVLTAQFGDYGCTPGKSSFAIHAMVVKHYLGGGAYPVGGAKNIANAMLPMLTKAGGEVLVNAKVKEIVVENGHAVGVKMEDGHVFKAGKIISNAGANLTYKHLLPLEFGAQVGIPGKVPNSPSHVCLYIGVEEDIEPYLDGNANFWIYPDPDHDATQARFEKDRSSEFPVVYISFPSAKDPEWKKQHPNKSTIEIITVAPYSWFSPWENERWMHRGEEYQALKDEFSQRLLTHLYRVVPALEGKIAFYELSTPLSTKHFAAYEFGEIYGLDHTPERFRMNKLRPRTPVKNLYLTGQDVVSVGIGGALIAGALTAQVVSGKNLLSKIGKRKKEIKAALSDS